MFRKETRRDDKQTFNGQSPRTEYVWFYEVQEDGFSLDAKRNPRPGQHNDLWDALVKFKAWIAQGAPAANVNEKNYFQPSFQAQRWRHALLRDTCDQLTPAGEAFSSLPDTGMWDGGVWGIHELFTDLPSTPEKAEAQIRSHATTALHDLVVRFFAPFSRQIWDEYNTPDGSDRETEATLAAMAWDKARKGPTQDFNRTAREFYRFFEPEDSPSLPIWKDLIKESLAAGMATLGKTRPKNSLPFL